MEKTENKLRPAMNVEVGSLWRDLDKRMHGRIVKITRVADGDGGPIKYERRMRPTWRPEDEGWSPWEQVSEGMYLDCLANPIVHEWQHEVRALYLHAERARVPDALRHAAKVIELYDDALGGSCEMATSTDCAEVLTALADYYAAAREVDRG